MSTTVEAPLRRALTRRAPSLRDLHLGSRIAAVAASPLLFWLLLFIICSARAFIGASGLRITSYDGFIVLDGAWRMLNSQRPHVDFNSMLGPVAYLPTLVGLLLSHRTAAGLGYGQAIVAFLLGSWAFVMARGLPPVARTLFALCTAAVVGSPALIGPSPLQIGPGMSYNRLGYGLLSLLLLDMQEEQGPSQTARGLSSGAALALLAFLKITFFFSGIILLLTSVVLQPRTRRRWVSILLSFTAISVGFLLYLHLRLDLVFRDLAITVAAKKVDLYSLYAYNTVLFEALIALAFVLGTAACLASQGDLRGAWRLRTGGLVVLALSCLMLFGNWQPSELPLIAFFAIVAIQKVWRADSKTQEQALRPFVLCTGGVFAVTMLASLTIALVTGIRGRMYTAVGAKHLHTPALASYIPVAGDRNYTEIINDGLNLLAPHLHPGDTLMCLDFSNPFTFGLHLRPAPGGTTNLQYHGSFDDTHKLSPQLLFGRADLVIVPFHNSDINLQDAIGTLYGPYLHSHYYLVGTSREWSLYRLNTDRLPNASAMIAILP